MTPVDISCTCESVLTIEYNKKEKGTVCTGCIEGFSKAENCKENVVESINTIRLFFILKKCAFHLTEGTLSISVKPSGIFQF